MGNSGGQWPPFFIPENLGGGSGSPWPRHPCIANRGQQAVKDVLEHKSSFMDTEHLVFHLLLLLLFFSYFRFLYHKMEKVS